MIIVSASLQYPMVSINHWELKSIQKTPALYVAMHTSARGKVESESFL